MFSSLVTVAAVSDTCVVKVLSSSEVVALTICEVKRMPLTITVRAINDSRVKAVTFLLKDFHPLCFVCSSLSGKVLSDFSESDTILFRIQPQSAYEIEGQIYYQSANS
jgi:hypothetical protein